MYDPASQACRMVQHIQISKHDTIHHENERQKSYDHQHPLMKKMLKKFHVQGAHCRIIKAICNKQRANIIMERNKLKSVSLT
jgi:hypothetical protein